MASQLKSSLASSLARRLVISGAPFRVSPNKRSFTVKAVQADKPTYQVLLANLKPTFTESSMGFSCTSCDENPPANASPATKEKLLLPFAVRLLNYQDISTSSSLITYSSY
uniref:Uncharacterized protein n=1 Tax=Salix viminalis TaxID=40686 RepID=A0A6N2LSU0_SALVM